MLNVVTFTVNPAIDKSAETDAVAAEIKIRCDTILHEAGGGGINVSRAIQKIGGSSKAIYTAGGPTGQMLTDLLIAEGIDHEAVSVAKITRQNLTIYERSTGLQYRFGMPGEEMTESEWKTCLATTLASNADLIVASGSLPSGVPTDFYGQLTEQAKQKGMRVIVDTSGEALEKAVQAGVFLLKPNLRELEIFSGTKIQSNEHLRSVARSLIAEGLAEVLVVSMGAAGAAFISADEYAHLNAPLVPIQSKVGAGDSMVGGITYGLAQEKSLLDAVRLGVAAGTAAVMTPGTQLCRREDVERLYGEIQITQ